MKNSLSRRKFLQTSTVAGLALSLPIPSFSKDYLKETRMGVVVHSYWSRWNSKTESKKYPSFTNAVELLDHCHEIGAGGIQVGVGNWAPDFTKKVRDLREKKGMYLEGSIAPPQKPEDVAKFEQDIVNAKEAGAKILRTVASSGRRYEVFRTEEAFLEAKKKSVTALQLAEPVVRKHKMKLAVENHKDWRAEEFAGILKELGSEWVGVTLDFGNSMALLEDPMFTTQTLLPYVFSTHVKDMAVEEYPEGFLLSEVPLGQGVVDVPAIVAMCKRQNPEVTFSLEMITRDPLQIPCLTDDYWATMKGVSPAVLAKMLRMVKQNTFKGGLPRVMALSGDERLAIEEQNIVSCLEFSRNKLGLA